MKTFSLSIFLLLFNFLSFAQSGKMKVTFRDGQTHTGIYEVQYFSTYGSLKKVRVISKNPKKKYKIEEIERVVCYNGNDSILIKPIPTYENIDSHNMKEQLGVQLYNGPNVEVYTIPKLGTPNISGFIHSYTNLYARKRGEDYYYNIGWIDGAGPRGLKRRIREFFSDCPLLIEKVESKEIPKEETLQIVKFYEEQCGV